MLRCAEQNPFISEEYKQHVLWRMEIRERVYVPLRYVIDFKKLGSIYKTLELSDLYVKGYALYREINDERDDPVGDIFKKKFQAAKLDDELLKIVADEKHVDKDIRFMADLTLMEVWNLPGINSTKPANFLDYFNNMKKKYGLENYLEGLKYLKGWCGATIDYNKAFACFNADTSQNKQFGLAQWHIAQMDSESADSRDTILEPIKKSIQYHSKSQDHFFELLRAKQLLTESSEKQFLLQELNHLKGLALLSHVKVDLEVKSVAAPVDVKTTDSYYEKFVEFFKKRKYTFSFLGISGTPLTQRTLFFACAAILNDSKHKEVCEKYINDVITKKKSSKKHKDLAMQLKEIIRKAEKPIKRPLHYIKDMVQNPEFVQAKASWNEAMSKADFLKGYKQQEPEEMVNRSLKAARTMETTS